MKKEFDARGMACPLPVINAKNETQNMSVGDIFSILVDNEAAVQNLTRFGNHQGFQVSADKISDCEYRIEMVINSVSEKDITEEPMDESEECILDQRKKGMVVVLSGDVMGNGDEKLGKALMKAFVFALTKQDQLPETVLCYNRGAFLSCQGADTLEDLKLLEAEGVTVLTCGTCLDFYDIKEKLAVGTVTNMYEIVGVMEQAKTIVRP